jgi:tagatose 1,6-diphosphate aldolase
MTRYDPSGPKRARLQQLSTRDGVIAALAIDQRKSLRKMLAAAAEQPWESVPDRQLSEFKGAVAEALTPHASAVLLDPDYGLPAAAKRAPACGLLLTYEMDGFENPRPHRMLALLPEMSVRRLRDLGAAGVKILLSYAPDDEPANESKRVMVERIGAECDALALPFFLEPVTYDPGGLDPRSEEYAQRKPEWVIRTMEEFSKPHYAVDVLKVEFPVTAAFVEDSPVFTGRRVYAMDEALDWYRAADAATSRPYIYLSAGVSTPEFLASLEMAAAAGARFSGVLCGRANWQGGAPEYIRGGLQALTHWLHSEGVANIGAVNARLRAATSWQDWTASGRQSA